MRILQVDADTMATSHIRTILGERRVIHECADTIEEGLSLARTYDYDAIITEAALPDGSGLQLVRQLREAAVRTPVIVLSLHDETQTRVEYLRMGADDYMSKRAVHPEELHMRLVALVRRSQGHASSQIVVGPVAVSLSEKTVHVGGQRVHLTGREYQMLELMFMRVGQTISKESFLTHMYGGLDEPEIKIVDVFVCKLRKKLARADAAAGRMVETVWGRGYTVRRPAVS